MNEQDVEKPDESAEDAGDASESPRPARSPRASKGERVVIGALIVVIAAGVVAFAYMAKQQFWPAGRLSMGARAAPEPSPFAALDGKTLGDAAAKVEVVALVPLINPCHRDTVAFLQKAVQDHPDNLRVRFVDFLSPAGHALAEKQYGCKCASILINGTNVFKNPAGVEFALKGPPDEGYSVEDVRVELNEALAAAYADKAPVLATTGVQPIGLVAKPPLVLDAIVDVPAAPTMAKPE